MISAYLDEVDDAAAGAVACWLGLLAAQWHLVRVLAGVESP